MPAWSVEAWHNTHTAMDGLSVAASVSAVVDASVKVITPCSQCSKAVTNARADIVRITTLVRGLKTTLDHAGALINGQQSQTLSTSHKQRDQLAGCQFTLRELQDKLELGVTRNAKRRFWVRALKWPFSRKETEATISALEHHHRQIIYGL